LYGKRIKILELINTFDKIRLSRHNVQYGGFLVSGEEAEFVAMIAEEILKVAREELRIV